jgi:hypothetical protein
MMFVSKIRLMSQRSNKFGKISPNMLYIKTTKDSIIELYLKSKNLKKDLFIMMVKWKKLVRLFEDLMRS